MIRRKPVEGAEPKPTTYPKCFKYGLLPPLNWDTDLDEVFRNENKFWNTLVELDRNSVKAWHDIYNIDSDHKELFDRFQGILSQIEELVVEIKTCKLKSNQDKEGNKEQLESLETEINTLKAERKEIWANLKKRKQVLKESNEYFTIKEKENSEKLNKDIKNAYQPTNSGLWWCNYNAVMDSFKNGKSLVLKKKDGSQMRFHTFKGTGRLVNQLQTPRKISEIFAGKTNQVIIKPLPEDAYTNPSRSQRRKLARTELTICAYKSSNEKGKSQPRHVVFPMIMHRPIPEDYLVTSVAVHAEDIAGKLEWNVVFSCSTTTPPPDPNTHSSEKICGINMGWRQVDNGLRIISIVDSDDNYQHVMLDELMVRKRLNYSRELQSHLDDALNSHRDLVKKWLDDPILENDDSSEAIQWKELALRTCRSKSPTMMWNLAIAWRNWPDFHPEWFVELELWRKVDKRKRQEKDNIRIKALNHRKEIYRQLARQLTMDYSWITLGQLNLKEAAKSKKAKNQENVLPAIARSNRQDASLYSFILELKHQASKHGCIIVDAERPVTKTCHQCGYSKNVVPAEDVIYRCKGCGAIYDRDINAATVALQDGFAIKNRPLEVETN